MAAKRLFCLFIILNLVCFRSNAVCTLTAKCSGGNWDAASTWTASGCGGITVPSDACIIIIPACATVTINLNSPTYSDMEIYVSGTLDFGNGQKLNMCPGYVQVNSGAQLTGGTPGSKINICGTTVYNGGSTTSGPITFGGGTTLPVELLSFNAVAFKNEVDLSWVTASETNNDFFTVQRTKEGLDFEDVSILNGAGNSNSIIEYYEKDFHPYEGISYYRLMQTDYDGNRHYSSLVPVNYSFGTDGISIYPNPSNNISDVILNLNFPENQEVLVVVRDVIGNELCSKVMVNTKEGKLIGLDPEHKLPAGVYLVVASSANEIYSKKLIIK